VAQEVEVIAGRRQRLRGGKAYQLVEAGGRAMGELCLCHAV
jgi:hypothetical protein